jgi:hypothetical protein
MIEVRLAELPMTHMLRNTPLVKIGAQYLPADSKVWADVKSSYGIAQKTYNQLGDSWTSWDVWRVTYS